jgi:hypothetical protein
MLARSRVLSNVCVTFVLALAACGPTRQSERDKPRSDAGTATHTEDGGPAEACATLDCDAGSDSCETSDAGCPCQFGFHWEGGACVEDGPASGCEDVTCDGGGVCVRIDEEPVCKCFEPYVGLGTRCIHPRDVCGSITCGGHGTCGLDASAQATCSCDDGYAADGTTCTLLVTCSEPDTRCRAGRELARCCSVEGCFYQAPDGRVFHGSSAALGYCHGDADGAVDGDCSGIAVPCASLPMTVCQEQAWCTWQADPGLCEGDSYCIEFAPDACNAIPGCYWTAPDPYYDGACGPFEQACVPNRRFRTCAGDPETYLAEDGTVFDSLSEALRHCEGADEG